MAGYHVPKQQETITTWIGRSTAGRLSLANITIMLNCILSLTGGITAKQIEKLADCKRHRSYREKIEVHRTLFETY